MTDCTPTTAPNTYHICVNDDTYVATIFDDKDAAVQAAKAIRNAHPYSEVDIEERDEIGDVITIWTF